MPNAPSCPSSNAVTWAFPRTWWRRARPSTRQCAAESTTSLWCVSRRRMVIRVRVWSSTMLSGLFKTKMSKFAHYWVINKFHILSTFDFVWFQQKKILKINSQRLRKRILLECNQSLRFWALPILAMSRNGSISTTGHVSRRPSRLWSLCLC